MMGDSKMGHIPNLNADWILIEGLNTISIVNKDDIVIKKINK